MSLTVVSLLRMGSIDLNFLVIHMLIRLWLYFILMLVLPTKPQDLGSITAMVVLAYVP